MHILCICKESHTNNLCVISVFFETLRLFPPVPGIPKKSAEDTTLMTTNNAGERVAIVVPKGSSVNLYTPGMHYNRMYLRILCPS